MKSQCIISPGSLPLRPFRVLETAPPSDIVLLLKSLALQRHCHRAFVAASMQLLASQHLGHHTDGRARLSACDDADALWACGVLNHCDEDFLQARHGI